MAFDLSSSWSNPSWTSSDQFGVGGAFSKEFYNQADSYGQAAFKNTASASTGTSPFGSIATAFAKGFANKLMGQGLSGGSNTWSASGYQPDSKKGDSGFLPLQEEGGVYGFGGKPAQLLGTFTPPPRQKSGLFGEIGGGIGLAGAALGVFGPLGPAIGAFAGEAIDQFTS